MNVFKHKFDGWHEADARRWKNPDGSEGGVVAVSASVHEGVTLPASVEVWPDAKIAEHANVNSRTVVGSRAVIGYGAIVGPYTSVGERATIGPRSIVGYGSVVSNRVLIGYNTTVGPRSIIGPSASLGDAVSIGENSSIGFRAAIGDGVVIGPHNVIGPGVVVGKKDWLFAAGPQGSRSAFATAVYSAEHGLRWWVGCNFSLTTEKLLECVDITHGASETGDDYRHLVQMVLNHPGLARAKAKKQETKP